MIQNGYFSDCETPWANCTKIRKIVLFSPCCPTFAFSFLLKLKIELYSFISNFELYTYYSLANFSNFLIFSNCSQIAKIDIPSPDGQ